MTMTTTTISSLVSTKELREAHATLSGLIEHLDARDQDILARCFAARQKLTEPCMAISSSSQPVSSNGLATTGATDCRPHPVAASISTGQAMAA